MPRRRRTRTGIGSGWPAATAWHPKCGTVLKNAFRIPQIFEFYAATEGGVSLFNIEGKRGAIGHIPAYLAHRFSPALVVFDVEKGEPVRNAQGFCIRCAPNEPGEAIGKVVDDPSNIGSRFEGYTNQEASERRILRDVFEPGDVWVRTGDLMRKDEQGYFYFVDRIGDTFRWKGENVATCEVSEAICAFPGVKHANVYGVTVPATEGRAGMATLVTDDELDLAALRDHLISRLPPYARPLFLRIRKNMDLTGTFKYSKTELVRQGYDPDTSNDISISTTWSREHSLGSIRICTSVFKLAVFASRVLSVRGRKERMVIDEIRSDFTQLQSDIANGPILPTVTAEEIRSYLASRYDFTRTLPLEEVIADVEKMLRTWQVQVTHPRYFGLFNPSVTLASVIADSLVAMYNPQLANWRTSPAANEIERHTLGWLAAKFGLPRDTRRDFHQRRNGGESFCRGGRTDARLP